MYPLIKQTALIFALTLTSLAQDSCPIPLEFYDAGVPQWLDRESLLEQLKSKASTKEKDPLIEKLMTYSNHQDCIKAIPKETSFDLEQRIHAESFIHQKSFNCNHAAQQLNQIDALSGGGKVIILRGSHRILFAHVGETSFCVQSSSLDGKKLNDRRVQKLYNRLFGQYINKKLATMDSNN